MLPIQVVFVKVVIVKVFGASLESIIGFSHSFVLTVTGTYRAIDTRFSLVFGLRMVANLLSNSWHPARITSSRFAARSLFDAQNHDALLVAILIVGKLMRCETDLKMERCQFGPQKETPEYFFLQNRPQGNDGHPSDPARLQNSTKFVHKTDIR